MTDNDKEALRAKFLQTGEMLTNGTKKGVSYSDAIQNKKVEKVGIFSKKKDTKIIVNQDSKADDTESEWAIVRFFKWIWRIIVLFVKTAILLAIIARVIISFLESEKSNTPESAPPAIINKPIVKKPNPPVQQTTPIESVAQLSAPVQTEVIEKPAETDPNANLIYGRFYKVSMKGFSIPENSQIGEKDNQWACTFDKESGLMWFVYDYPSYIYWFNPNPSTNGGDAGYKDNGGKDTASLIKQYNSEQRCGITNWRLPTLKEVESLIKTDLSRGFPQLTMELLPNSKDYYIWTSQTLTDDATQAILFHIQCINGGRECSLYKSFRAKNQNPNFQGYSLKLFAVGGTSLLTETDNPEEITSQAINASQQH